MKRQPYGDLVFGYVLFASSIGMILTGCGIPPGGFPFERNQNGNATPPNGNTPANLNENSANDNAVTNENAGNDNEAANDNANDNGEPTLDTFLRISNFGGLPMEIYVEDEFLTLVEPGETSELFPIEPGAPRICVSKIGMIDLECENIQINEGEINELLLS